MHSDLEKKLRGKILHENIAIEKEKEYSYIRTWGS